MQEKETRNIIFPIDNFQELSCNPKPNNGTTAKKKTHQQAGNTFALYNGTGILHITEP